jgi:hypothetical protein
MEMKNNELTAGNIGVISSWSLAVLTIITFGLAMIAIPPSGPNCLSNCMDYPYADILTYFPRDYFWMYAACVQLCVFLFFTVAFHFNAPADKKIFSSIAVIFAIMSALTLMTNYWVQIAVVPVSVMQGQSEGIALLTQYNGHGIFIALEELGFSLMAIAFFFLGQSLNFNSRLEKSLRVVLTLPVILCVLAIIGYSVQYGIDRDYRYEVAAITINWLAAIVTGILSGFYFRRLKTNRDQ